MTNEEAKQAVAKLFYYLDTVEESDSGNEFHPNFISSCRVLDGAGMRDVLATLRQWVSIPSETDVRITLPAEPIEPYLFWCGRVLYRSDPTGESETEIYDEVRERWSRLDDEERRALDKCRWPRDYTSSD